MPAPLSIRTGGRGSSTLRPPRAVEAGPPPPPLDPLAPPVGVEAGLLGGLGDLADGGLGLLLVGHVAPVQARDRLLVLEGHAQPPQVLGVVLAREVLHAPRPSLELAVHLGRDRTRAQDLRPV